MVKPLNVLILLKGTFLIYMSLTWQNMMTKTKKKFRTDISSIPKIIKKKMA